MFKLFLKILSLAIFSRLLFFIFAITFAYFLPLRPGYLGSQAYPNLPDYITVWANFDGRHFLDIASNGYQKSNFVYFPLYPVLIYLVSKIFSLSLVYSGILISLSAYTISLFVLYKVVRLDFGQRLSFWTLIIFSFFPTSYYYQSIYSESVFFLFLTLAIYFFRVGKYSRSVIFCFLTSLTRLTGIILIPTLVVEWYLKYTKTKRKDLIKDFAIKCLPVLIAIVFGIFVYALYQKIVYGDWFLFLKSFSAWNREKLTFPLQVIYRYLKIFVVLEKDKYIYWIAVLEFVFALVYIYLSYINLKKIRISYAVLIISGVILSSLTGSFIGMPRYALHFFPGFMALAYISRKKLDLKESFILILIILGAFLTSLFGRGYFVS